MSNPLHHAFASLLTPLLPGLFFAKDRAIGLGRISGALFPAL